MPGTAQLRALGLRTYNIKGRHDRLEQTGFHIELRHKDVTVDERLVVDLDQQQRVSLGEGFKLMCSVSDSYTPAGGIQR